MTTPSLSPAAKALLRDLLRITEQKGHRSYIDISIESDSGEGDAELLAAVRELAGTEVDMSERPATEEDLRGLGIPVEGSVIVTSGPVLHIEATISPVDAPDEPAVVTVMLGSVPRDQLASLAALEAEADS